jgi:hypothetical protein
MKRHFPLLTILISFMAVLLPAFSAKAQTLLPFGGLVSVSIDCDCSGTVKWIWFTPLYLGGPLTLSGPMAYSSSPPSIYAQQNVGTIGKWHVGDYTPGVQACWIVAGNSCISLPVYGLIVKVGTN